MPTRAPRALVLLTLLGSPSLFAETPPTRIVTPPEAEACLARLLIVTGLGGDETLTIGGDEHVVLVHQREGGSRYWAFSKVGYATLDKPWPAKDSNIEFLLTVDNEAHRFRWMVRGGRVQAEATGASAKRVPRPDVQMSAWRALDDDAWNMIARIVTLKLPMVMKSLEEQREYSAKKHMTFSVALGHEDAYRECTNLGPGTIGEKLDGNVRRQHAAWKKLAETPVEYEKYELVRRADHPEWRACSSTADCTVAAGPCGWPDMVAKSERAHYERWRKTREEQINCDVPDEDARVVTACVAHECIDREVVAREWDRCFNDASCSVAMMCDQPVAVSKGLKGAGAFSRSAWWAKLDSWDRCGDKAVPVPAGVKARCVAQRCQLVR